MRGLAARRVRAALAGRAPHPDRAQRQGDSGHLMAPIFSANPEFRLQGIAQFQGTRDF